MNLSPRDRDHAIDTIIGRAARNAPALADAIRNYKDRAPRCAPDAPSMTHAWNAVVAAYDAA